MSLFRDDLIPLADAARLIPRKGGKRASVATLYRWTSRGVRGVRLEYVQAGATRCTTAAALERFFAAVGAARPPGRSAPTPPLAARAAAADRTERELVKAGF